MSACVTVALGGIMASKTGSIDPAKFPKEIFDLYSIPAYDLGEPEVIAGEKIGSTKQIVQPDDVLLSKIVPHIRRSWIVGRENGRRLIASGEWIVFRDSHIYPSYLRHLLMADMFHAQFMSTVSGVGGSLLRARPAHVANIKISLPPLPEQRRIAEVLDKAEELRAKRLTAFDQLNEISSAIFTELFGDTSTIYSKWPVKPLGKILDFLTSGSRGWAQYYSDEGDLFLRIHNVCKDELTLDDVAYVNAPETAESRRTHVRPGDVLLSITADLGRTAVIPEGLSSAFINQHLAILRTNALVPRFLSAYLSSPAGQREILGRNKHAVKAGLNFDDIRSFQIPMPPMRLQKDFALRLGAVDKLKAAHRASLAELDALFASLQHRAFRGEL